MEDELRNAIPERTECRIDCGLRKRTARKRKPGPLARRKTELFAAHRDRDAFVRYRFAQQRFEPDKLRRIG